MSHDSLESRHPSSPRANLSVTEIARLTGLTVRALKYYEEVGLLEPPRKVGHARIYLGVDLDKIETIARLRSGGLEVAEIVEVFREEDPERIRQNVAIAVRARLVHLDAERHRLIELLSC